MNNQSKKRNWEVELYRFIFAIVILLHHSYLVVGKENAIMPAGSLAVEFFFLLSGYLMMNTIEKYNNRAGALLKETIVFSYNKVKSLFPEIAFSFLAGYMFVTVACKMNVKIQVMTIANTFLNDIFMLKMTGMLDENLSGGVEILPIVWYVSSMILSMLILYPLYVKLGRKKRFRIVMTIFAVVIMLGMRGLRNPFGEFWGIYRGNWRCFAEIILGTSIYWMKKGQFLTRVCAEKEILLSKLKWILSGMILIFCALTFGGALKDYVVFVFIYVMLLIVLTIEADFSPEMQKWSMKVGKYSVSLYLCHCYYALYLGEVMNGASSLSKIVIYLLISSVTALIVCALSEMIRKNKNKVNECIEKNREENTKVSCDDNS